MVPSHWSGVCLASCGDGHSRAAEFEHVCAPTNATRQIGGSDTPSASVLEHRKRPSQTARCRDRKWRSDPRVDYPSIAGLEYSTTFGYLGFACHGRKAFPRPVCVTTAAGRTRSKGHACSRSSIQPATSDARHATVFGDIRTGLGNVPADIAAYRVERGIPVRAVTSARRRSFSSFPIEGSSLVATYSGAEVVSRMSLNREMHALMQTSWHGNLGKHFHLTSMF